MGDVVDELYHGPGKQVSDLNQGLDGMYLIDTGGQQFMSKLTLENGDKEILKRQ